MKTFVEIRVLEKWANQEFGPSLGEPLSDPGQPAYVRRIVLEVGNPRLDDLRARLKRDNDHPAVGVEREYTDAELSSAELFQLIVTDCFHPDACGEDFGTEYDDSNACPKCGAGRIQRSPLKLDLSLAKRGADIVRTIAMGELIISQRFADLLRQYGITGYRTSEVQHVGKREPKGRWHQLIVTGKAGHTVDPTHFGINFFEEDSEGMSWSLFSDRKVPLNKVETDLTNQGIFTLSA